MDERNSSRPSILSDATLAAIFVLGELDPGAHMRTPEETLARGVHRYLELLAAADRFSKEAPLLVETSGQAWAALYTGEDGACHLEMVRIEDGDRSPRTMPEWLGGSGRTAAGSMSEASRINRWAAGRRSRERRRRTGSSVVGD